MRDPSRSRPYHSYCLRQNIYESSGDDEWTTSFKERYKYFTEKPYITTNLCYTSITNRRWPSKNGRVSSPCNSIWKREGEGWGETTYTTQIRLPENQACKKYRSRLASRLTKFSEPPKAPRAYHRSESAMSRPLPFLPDVSMRFQENRGARFCDL